MWKAVGGYRQAGVYAGDDAYILVDCAQRGFSWQMSDSIVIVHPMDDDAEYNAWKARICQRDSHTGPKNEAQMMNIVKEFDDFWAKR